MNYYAQGGQAYGLKSLAQELPKYGRYGDSIVAHINPQEAMILKAMGGSGTINPYTGLPEYNFFKGITQPFVDVWKGITNLPGIKQVSDAVTPLVQEIAPYAPYIAPFIPMVGPLMAAGIGAAGAGFGGKGRSGFDFKRGLMGGMTAYGLSNLYTGLQAAATAGTTAPSAVDVASSLGVEGASSAPGSQASMLAEMTGPGFGSTGGVASSASYANPAANFIGSAAEGGAQAIAQNAPNAGMFEATPNSIPFDKSLASSVPQSLQIPNLSSMPSRFATEMGNAGSGLQNLVGLGEGTMSEAAKAVGTKFGTGSAGALLTGVQGMSALDEQQKYLDEAKAAGTIDNTEYQAQVARIEESRKRGEDAMIANPYRFAVGGQVDDELGGDYSAMGMDQGNLQKGLFGMGNADMFGLSGNSLMSMFNSSAQQNTPQMSPNADQNPNTSMGGFASPSSFYGGDGGSGLASYGGGNSNAFPLEGQYGIVKMAAGGMPRFLSGGGDGMSDSIKASINGTQEARLADGEFVIPADVVSHIGNGSSKAGAKQLYSMMDRVRSARTGRKSQGKQINPRKLMAA